MRVLSPAETAAAQDAHDDWQRERDPAVKMFAGLFGKAWADRLADEVLFPSGAATAAFEAGERTRVIWGEMYNSGVRAETVVPYRGGA